jgi:glutamate-ammonia-ligase adenylyltransferase
MEAVAHDIYHIPWRPELADEIQAMRKRVEATGSKRDLKRGFGGIVDIEFLVQMVRLKYGRSHPAVREPNTWQALDAIHAAGLITAEEHAALISCYEFMRLVENRLRIYHNRSLDELPERSDELEKLAHRVGCAATAERSCGQEFLAELDRHTLQTRRLFKELFKRERGGPPAEV